jgi:hypothetical protein
MEISEITVIGYSDQPVEVIWNQIIDFYRKEMEIKLDGSAGLIIQKSKLPATYEDADGNLYFPDSYVVVQQESVMPVITQRDRN